MTDRCLSPQRAWEASSSVQELLLDWSNEGVMSLVRFLGFSNLPCGCVIGKYRELATSREICYVEEKGSACGSHTHRRNHTISTDRLAPTFATAFASKAS